MAGMLPERRTKQELLAACDKLIGDNRALLAEWLRLRSSNTQWASDDVQHQPQVLQNLRRCD